MLYSRYKFLIRLFILKIVFQFKLEFNKLRFNMKEKNKKAIVCAITGGIGAGKTAASTALRELGYPVVSSDENAKRLMTENKEVKREIVETFGEEAYNSDGSVNAEYLSDKVFGDSKSKSENLQKLNSITHPRTIEKNLKEIEKLKKSGESLIFVESALTFESGIADKFDYVIVVDAPKDLAIERTAKRLGVSKEEIEKREQRQISRAEKKRRADFVIKNDGDLKKLKRSAAKVAEKIKRRMNA